MKLELTLHPIPGLPAPTGPHQLAWSYLLDAIFADAYHTGISHLHVSLPTEQLSEEVTLRAELSARPNEAERQAVAILGRKRDLPAGYGGGLPGSRVSGWKNQTSICFGHG